MKANQCKYFILIVILQCIYLIRSSAQSDLLKIREDQNTFICEECKNSKREIVRLVKNEILKYQQACTFIDLDMPSSASELVTGKSQEEFTEMFSYTAMVYNDLKEYSDIVSKKDYAAFVAKHFPRGISQDKLIIADVYIEKIGYNEEIKSFELKLKVTKTLFVGVNKNDKVVQFKNGKVIPMTMLMNIPESLVEEEIKIYGITGDIITAPKAKKKEIDFFLSSGINQPGYKLYPSITQNIKSNYREKVGIGAQLAVGFASNKSSTFVLGLELFTQHLLFTSSNSLINHEIQNSYNGLLSTRKIKYEGYSEDVRLLNAKANIGANLVLYKRNRYEYGLSLYISPIYSLYSKNSASFAKIHYDEVLNSFSSSWCSDSITNYQHNFSNEYSKINLSFSSILYYEKDLTYDGKKRIRVGLEYTYHITDLFSAQFLELTNINLHQSQTVTNTLINSRNFLNSVKSPFISSLKPHYFGLRLSYIISLNKSKF